MKKFVISGIFILFSVIIGNISAMAADAKVAMDLNSAYVWRGITYNDGMVLQPSVDVAKAGFDVNVWGNIDMDDYNNTLDSGEFSEVDLTLSYGFDLDPVSISTGYVEYLYPAGGKGTREVFVSLGKDLYKGLNAKAVVYYDFDEYKGAYFNFGLGYNVPVNDVFSLDFGASAGYMGNDVSVGGESGFNEYQLSVGGTYAATKALSISGKINYTDAIDKDVLPEGPYGQDVNCFGGISVAYAF
jgi:hypothetical protein